MSQPVTYFQVHVNASEAHRIASREIFEGLMKPDDVATATTVFPPSLEYLPVWRVSVETTGFHLGLGSGRRTRGRIGRVTVSTPSTHLGVNHHADEQIIVAHRHFPMPYLPLSSLLRFDPMHMARGDISELAAMGAVLPVDVSQAEAEHEVTASVMRRVAPETALFTHYEPRITTLFAYVPLYIVRYAYRGIGRRHANEEYWVTVCGQRGTILAKHHPHGGGLFGAVGRFFVGPNPHHAAPPPQPPPPPVPWTPWAPPPPPPQPPPPSPADREPQGSQVLAIASTISLVDARSRMARALADLPLAKTAPATDGAPLLVHVPFWRVRMQLQKTSLTEAFRAPGVLVTSDPHLFIVPAVSESALRGELEALAELSGFEPPEMGDSRAIAPVEKRTLEAGAILLEADVSREVAGDRVVRGCGATPADIASARLVYYPLYVQRLAGDRKYLVISATTGRVLGARYPIAINVAPVTPPETGAAAV